VRKHLPSFPGNTCIQSQISPDAVQEAALQFCWHKDLKTNHIAMPRDWPFSPVN